MTVQLPKNVADAIETIWSTKQPGSQAVKYLWLTNWDLLATTNPTEYPILLDFATKSPVDYMTALTNGYDIEFDKGLEFNTNGVELSYTADIINEDYTTNHPLLIAIGTAFEALTIEDAKTIADNINVLIQELKKVREV